MKISSDTGIKSLLISVMVFCTVCIMYYLISVSKTDGHYVYLIDDAYIHLAMAKNIALHEVWGITRYRFSSTSSSPLFTSLLGLLIRIFGNDDRISLYVNFFSGMGTVYFLHRYFKDIFRKSRDIVLSVLFTLFISVMHLQLLSGMEHVLHVFLFVVSIFCLSRLPDKPAVFGFYVSLLLMGLVRFESMFYFIVLAFLFVLLQRWKEAGCILLTGFIPVAIFCYFNYSHDGYLFPNSVVVKGTTLSFDAEFFHQMKSILLDNLLLNISFYKIGFFPLLISLIIVIRDFRKKTFRNAVQDNMLIIAVSLLMILHSMFADLKGLFRYEAYLLTGFSMALIPRLKPLFENTLYFIRKDKLIAFLVLMNIVLLFYKCSIAHPMICNGGKSIREQQIQSARFLHTYYNESKVVANDIGAITYYTDICVLDIAGLASVETIPFNRNRRPVDDAYENFLTQYTADNGYDIAIIYDSWLQGHIPGNWKKAAVLKIENPATVAQDEVSVYSIQQGNYRKLKENIRNFRWNKNVRVTIMD